MDILNDEELYDCYNLLLAKHVVNAPFFEDPEKVDNFDLFVALQRAYYEFKDCYHQNSTIEDFCRNVLSIGFPSEFVEQFMNQYNEIEEAINFNPIAGIIIVNKNRTKVHIVSSKKGIKFFPKGKLSGDENCINLLDCALKECFEETSLDLTEYVDASELFEYHDSSKYFKYKNGKYNRFRNNETYNLENKRYTFKNNKIMIKEGCKWTECKNKGDFKFREGKTMYFYIALTDIDDYFESKPLFRGEVKKSCWEDINKIGNLFPSCVTKSIQEDVQNYIRRKGKVLK